MSSLPPAGPEICRDSLVAPDTDNTPECSEPVLRKKTYQSPFKVPDNDTILKSGIKEKEKQKEAWRKYLDLGASDKMGHASQATGKLRRDDNQQQVKSKTAVSKGSPVRHDLKQAMLKRENITKDSKYDIQELERENITLEFIVREKKAELMVLKHAVEVEENEVKLLEKFCEGENLYLKDIEKKSLEAKTLYDQQAQMKQKINAEIEKLTADIETIKSQNAKLKETADENKTHYELLFKLAPVEWQEAQKAKTLKTKAFSDGHTEEEQNKEPEASDAGEGLQNEASSPDGELPSLAELRLSSSHSSDTLFASSEVDISSFEHKDQLEIYFTEPQQFIDQMMELKEQILSLIKNTERKEEEVEELNQAIEATENQMKQDEEQHNLLVRDKTQKIQNEEAKAAKLKKWVQIHESLETVDQDVMLDALTKKLAEVYRCSVDGQNRMPNLGSLEMLAAIERHVFFLLESLETIPANVVDQQRKIKDSERRSRQREELQREEKAKREEKMKRHLERSLANTKKKSGRKLMPRCLPVAPKAKDITVDSNQDEDEIYYYLFTPDD